jgi:G3E family GTPase
VVEASGVADPAKIADFARLSPSLVLDRVIVLVDAEQVRSQFNDSYVGEMVEKQLVAADVLILNKRDLVSSAQWVSVSDWLLAKAPMATMLVAEQANVPLEDLLSTDQQLGGHQPSVAPAGRKKEPGSADHHRAHSASLRTWQFTSTTPLDRDKLQNLLASLPNSIVRMKGFVRFSDAPGELQSLQRVGSRCSIVEHCAVGTEDQGTRLVVLGNIEMPDEDQLQSWFLSVLAN